MVRRYSIIIPVFNRPDEIEELLESLAGQTYKNFEVLIIEDGSRNTCEAVAGKYRKSLKIKYYYKENEGQGFARNYGYERAEGDYYIVFDSDCIIPSNYLQIVQEYLDRHDLDAFGGPDKAHPSFTPVQKAINYAMTSPFTTGGTRGGRKRIGPYHPRSFNMGISPGVFRKTGGYIIPFKGEDIEFSIRIIRNGFKTGLIPEAFVYHKRRTSWLKFFNQLHFFGQARINISRFFPDQLKWVHWLPAFFTMGLLFSLIALIATPLPVLVTAPLYLIYFLTIFADSLRQNKSLIVACLSIWASFLQLTAYGLGFIREGIVKLLRAGRSPESADR